MNNKLRDSGTSGRYGVLPITFTSATYAKYHPTHSDFLSKFYALLRKWRFETLSESSADVIVGHESFREIVKLGNVALPLIVAELRVRPDFLVAAMSLITDSNPVPEKDRGDLSAMAATWIDWYDRHR